MTLAACAGFHAVLTASVTSAIAQTRLAGKASALVRARPDRDSLAGLDQAGITFKATLLRCYYELSDYTDHTETLQRLRDLAAAAAEPYMRVGQLSVSVPSSLRC